MPALVESGATAVELMVAPALMVAAQNIAGAPQDWLELPPTSAALLVEFGAETDGELDRLVAGAEEILREHELIRPPDFTRDPERIEVSWTVREGLHGLIGRFRPPGTSLIIEDVCVPPERIAESARDIQALLTEHGFLPGVAGHTSAGNLHFMLTPDFSKQEDVERYEAFMEKLVELVLDKYDGSLKAEHGTGINMSPYVEREWGERATELMWRVKALADPDGVLAPGVVLNRDGGAHLRNLKTTPEIEEVATTCVECGFCEPVCPSRHLTTTPRQRIVIRREMARQPAGSPVQRALLEQYEYDGIQTCAADGTCQIACPLGIDTGKLVKGFRAREHTAARPAPGGQVAERCQRSRALARAGLRTGMAAGPLMRAAADASRALFTDELVPDLASQHAAARAGEAAPDLTRGRRRRLHAGLRQPDLRPASIKRVAPGGAPRTNGLHLPEAMVAVSARAGLPVWIPDDVAGHCCSVPWTSKGYSEGAGADGEPDHRGALALERGGRAADRDRRELLRPRPRRARSRTTSPRRTGSATESSRSSTRSPGRSACSPSFRSARSSAPSPFTRPARPGTSGSSASCARSPTRWRTRWSSRSAPPAAGWRATAACSTRS